MALAARARPENPPKSKRQPKPVEYNILLTATLCLLAFINEYVDKKKHSPKWLLTSFWG